ncbi:hypothetical protein LZC95_19420 [Pendulispora brunnea]|uniref:Uncharacterized protein n=1 Tax=Pendulispora brunnea TaxID=2905690 RepID=A0ABZ2KMS2_9BACT
MVRQAGWKMVPGDTYGLRLFLHRRRNQGAWDEYAAMMQRALKGIVIPGREAVVDAQVRVMVNRVNPHAEVTVTAFAGRADPERSSS